MCIKVCALFDSIHLLVKLQLDLRTMSYWGRPSLVGATERITGDSESVVTHGSITYNYYCPSRLSSSFESIIPFIIFRLITSI